MAGNGVLCLHLQLQHQTIVGSVSIWTKVACEWIELDVLVKLLATRIYIQAESLEPHVGYCLVTSLV